MNVLRLRPTDTALMRELNAMFAVAFADADSYANAPPGDAYLEALLAKDDFIALAAVEQEAVVGGLVAYELQKFEQARREI